MAAQENIKGAIVEAYAKAVDTRRYIQDVLQKRESTISALIASFDAYEDLLAKANKGIEFYTKLETNVSKLLQRIKSASKVQQEERDQMLLKNDIPNPEMPATTTAAPKLKDYLESRKRIATGNYPDSSMPYPSVMNYQVDLPPGIRPAPLGSEVTDIPKISIQEPYGQNPNIPYGYNPAYSPNKNQYAIPKQQEDDLSYRMNSLLSSPKSGGAANQNYQQYSHSSYIPQNYTPTSYSNSQFNQLPPKDVSVSYDVSKASTTTTNSYKPLSSYSTPNDIHNQYPDSNLNATSVSPSQPYIYSPPGYSTPFQSSNQNTPQHNVNTYYPTGYAPNYQTNYDNAQNQSSQESVQYHSVQYATSVPGEQPNYSYSSTYSSPVVNMASAQINDTSYSATGHYSGKIANNVPGISNFENVPDSFATNYQQQYPQSYSLTPTSYSASTSQASSNPYNYYQANSASIPSSTAYQSGQDNSTHYNSQSYNQPKSSNRQYSPVPQDQSYPQSSTLGQNIAGASFNQTPLQSYQTYDASYPQAAYGAYGNTLVTQTNQTPSSSYPQPGIAATANNLSHGSFGNVFPQPYQTPTSMYSQTGATPLSGNATYGSYGNYYDQSYVSMPPNYPNSQQVPPTQTQVSMPASTSSNAVKESNIDLLTGLDFTITQTPLVPQQHRPKSEETNVKVVPDMKTTISKTSATEENTQPVMKKPNIKVLLSKSLNNSDVKRLFEQEIEKYEKFVETLTNKTLSGPTNLDIKWKEIQEKQDCDGQKKVISVARCYPMKNRFPDILPYDSSRVELISSKDDYINASFIKVCS